MPMARISGGLQRIHHPLEQAGVDPAAHLRHPAPTCGWPETPRSAVSSRPQGDAGTQQHTRPQAPRHRHTKPCCRNRRMWTASTQRHQFTDPQVGQVSMRQGVNSRGASNAAVAIVVTVICDDRSRSGPGDGTQAQRRQGAGRRLEDRHPGQDRPRHSGLFAAAHVLRALAAPGQTIGILAATPALRGIYVKRYGFISVAPGSLELIVTVTFQGAQPRAARRQLAPSRRSSDRPVAVRAPPALGHADSPTRARTPPGFVTRPAPSARAPPPAPAPVHRPAAGARAPGGR